MNKLTNEDKKEITRLHEEYGYGNVQLNTIYDVNPTIIHRLLKHAFDKIVRDKPESLIIHSGQEKQYQMKDYQEHKIHGIRQSMSKKGEPLRQQIHRELLQREEERDVL